MVKDCDPSTGEPDEEGYEDEYVVCVGLKFFPFFTLFFFWCMKVFLVRNRGTSSAAKIASLVRQWQRLQALFSHPQSVFSSFICSVLIHMPYWSEVQLLATKFQHGHRKVYLFSNCPFFSLHLVHNRGDTCRNNLSISWQIFCFLGNSKFFPFRYYNHSSVLNDTGPLST